VLSNARDWDGRKQAKNIMIAISPAQNSTCTLEHEMAWTLFFINKNNQIEFVSVNSNEDNELGGSDMWFFYIITYVYNLYICKLYM